MTEKDRETTQEEYKAAANWLMSECRNNNARFDCDGPDCDICTIRDAHRAVMLCVKKKPRKLEPDGTILCPSCNREIKFEPLDKASVPVSRCWMCGQAIDWSCEK